MSWVPRCARLVGHRRIFACCPVYRRTIRMRHSLTSLVSKITLLALCSSPVVTTMVLVGCGNGPMQPSADNSQRQLATPTPFRIPSGDEYGDGAGGGFNMPTNWTGGPRSIAVGPAITPAQVMASVESLAAVQAVKADFANRGYTRDAARDTCFLNPKPKLPVALLLVRLMIPWR